MNLFGLSFGITFTSRSFFEDKIDLQDVARMLGRMNRASVLRCCAQLIALNDSVVRFNGGWRSIAGQSLVPELARLLFPLDNRSRQRVNEVGRDPDFVAPFIDFAIAGAMGLACRYCPESGGQNLIKDLRRRENLTRILLQLQEHALPAEDLSGALEKGRFETAFPKLTRSILASVSHQNEWMKDLGRLHILTSEAKIRAALVEKGFTDFEQWFDQRLGVSPSEFQALCQIFLSCAFSNAINSKQALQDFLSVNAGKFDFLRLVVTDPLKISSLPEPKTLEDSLFGPIPLWISPVLKDGPEFFISSSGWLFNKLLRGFPYLILEAEKIRAGRDLSNDEVKGIRGEFGVIFEAYVCWLLRQWFRGGNVQVIAPYYVKEANGNWSEKDFLLIHEKVGYAFEIKALVPPLGLRQNSKLEDWLKYLAHIADQSVDAATALVSGRAYLPDKQTQIPELEKAYPCAVTFEASPFRQPIVEPFESALTAKLGKSVFGSSVKVGPLQFFDVETMESWDEFYQLPAEACLLFDLLRERAESVVHRYSGFGRMGRERLHVGLLGRASEDASQAVLAKADKLSAAVPLPQHLQPFGPQVRTVGGPWKKM